MVHLVSRFTNLKHRMMGRLNFTVTLYVALTT